MKANALIIGCGNIGGMYDLEGDKILSHAKALHHIDRYQLYFFDEDVKSAKRLADKYQGIALTSLDGIETVFDWVSIAVPTEWHLTYYKKFAGKTKCILLEKPISYELQACEEMRAVRSATGQLTYINHIRNFLPAYRTLKSKMAEVEEQEHFSEILIKYQRGLINNASHAFALLSMLLEIDLSKKEIYQKSFIEDFGTNDATLSVSLGIEERFLSCIGLKEKEYPFFEVELFSAQHHVRISNSGNKIEILKKEASGIDGIALHPVFEQDHCLDNYMLKVIEDIHEELDHHNAQDNFESMYHVTKALISLCQNSR